MITLFVVAEPTVKFNPVEIVPTVMVPVVDKSKFCEYIFPATYKLPLIPTPPPTTNAPVEELYEE